ncbi:MAG: T9SS type A sorting domain-containing protein, partial [Salinivirgaceae bacterium]
DTASYVTLPLIGDGTSQFFTNGGTYLINLQFNGTYLDHIDRPQTWYIGGNDDQKIASGGAMLVPGGAPYDDVGWLKEYPGIALHMSFQDEYPYAEYETTFSVTSSDGAVYEGATVTVAGTQIDTDADGNAVFMLEDGDYPYAVDAEGLDTPVEGSFSVAGAAQTIEVELPISSIFAINTVDFNIYPNPSNGVFNVDVDGNATVTVMNAVGQVVESFTTSGSKQINLDNVNTGVYFVRVQVDNKVGTKQLIIR